MSLRMFDIGGADCGCGECACDGPAFADDFDGSFETAAGQYKSGWNSDGMSILSGKLAVTETINTGNNSWAYRCAEYVVEVGTVFAVQATVYKVGNPFFGGVAFSRTHLDANVAFYLASIWSSGTYRVGWGGSIASFGSGLADGDVLRLEVENVGANLWDIDCYVNGNLEHSESNKSQVVNNGIRTELMYHGVRSGPFDTPKNANYTAFDDYGFSRIDP